mmetsp:Transcript_106527/g.306301  ORF Transcript_106527/g.306301 Transcript_106527/m.306301 type:complete len:550 (+) Transcript_106527:86-1735(+)
MIEYYHNPLYFFRCRGSPYPRALGWAIPATVLAIAYNYLIHVWIDEVPDPSDAEKNALTFFSSMLGFLVVFRAQQAYWRYWEGITLVDRACAVWINGASNVIAFCSADPDRQLQVGAFQHILTRLCSLLLSVSMSDLSFLPYENFEILGMEGINPDSLHYLDDQKEAKVKVVLQWIQRLIVENNRNGTIDIAAPILSRVFQEFSIGIVHMVDANKISQVPFPFPFAQTNWFLLAFFSLGPMPFICAAYLSPERGAIYTFICVFIFWSVYFIALDIEEPFGTDSNDLPLEKIMCKFNLALETLLEPSAQQPPRLIKTTEKIRNHIGRCVSMSLHDNDRQLSVDINELKSNAMRSSVDTNSDSILAEEPSLPKNEQDGSSGRPAVPAMGGDPSQTSSGSRRPPRGRVSWVFSGGGKWANHAPDPANRPDGMCPNRSEAVVSFWSEPPSEAGDSPVSSPRTTVTEGSIIRTPRSSARRAIARAAAAAVGGSARKPRSPPPETGSHASATSPPTASSGHHGAGNRSNFAPDCTEDSVSLSSPCESDPRRRYQI